MAGRRADRALVAGVLVTAVALGAMAPLGTADDLDEVQLVGRPLAVTGCLGELPMVVTVERAGEGWTARVVHTDPLCQAWELAGADLYYALDGDWATGFVGAGEPSPLLGWIEIGPYGDGTEVFFQGCAWHLPQCTVWTYALLEDARLDEQLP